MYRNFTLYAGIILIFLSILMLFGIIPTSTALILTMSIAACILTLSDLIGENSKRKVTFISILDFAALVTVSLSILVPDINKYDQYLNTTSNFTTFLGFSLVIFSIGLRNSKAIKKMLQEIEDSKRLKTIPKSNMYDKQTRQITKKLADIEHNCVLDYNDIIIDLKECDQDTYKKGRVHDGWAIFHDCLVENFNDYNEPFYDMQLNNVFKEFSNELGQAVLIFANASDPGSRRMIRKVNMWGDEIDITSYCYSFDDNVDEGIKLLYSSLEKWNDLKELSNHRYEIYRKRAGIE